MVVGEWFRAWLVAHNVGIATNDSSVLVVARHGGESGTPRQVGLWIALKGFQSVPRVRVW